MTTKTMKKTISGILAAVLTTASLISLLPAAYAGDEEGTSETYSIYKEGEYDTLSDGTTKVWKYRNLLPEEGEDEGKVTYRDPNNTGSGYTEVTKDTANVKSGSYSWKGTPKVGSGSIRFEIDRFHNGDYYFSGWMKAEDNDGNAVKFADGNANFCLLNTYYYNGETSNDGNMLKAAKDGDGSSSFTLTGTDWNRIAIRRSSSYRESGKDYSWTTSMESNTAKAAAVRVGLNGNAATTTATDATFNMWLDDCSFRLTPDWKVNATGVSVANNMAKWTFDKDIDKWTVTKDLFTVSEGVTINNVAVATDETTRETTLTVSYSSDSGMGTITLPDGIKDAWGRTIDGVDDYKNANISTVDATYDSTAESELDAWGKWKYRNLLPEEGTESTTTNAVGNVTYKSNNSYVAVQKDESDKHTGAYSWKASVNKGDSMKVMIDGLVEGSYYASMWAKVDTDSTDSYPFYLVRNWTNDNNVNANGGNFAGQRQEPFQDKNGGTNYNIQVTKDWKHYGVERKHTGGESKLNTNTAFFITANFGETLGSAIDLLVDDWSFRLIPEWNVNFKEKVSVLGENKIRWTFDKDIDPWTCTKDLFGAEGCTVTDVNVATDEKTRVTTLTVTYNVTGADAKITLPAGITDAWGRTIQGLGEDDKTFNLSELTEFSPEDGEFVRVIGAEVPSDALVFVASYDASGALLGMGNVTVSGGVARGTAANVSSASEVKLFVWTKDLKPICTAIGLK